MVGPLLADVDGNGRADVVAICDSLTHRAYEPGAKIGGVAAWTADGEPIDLSPDPAHSVLLIENKPSSLVIDDLENDGRADLLAQSSDDFIFSGEPIPSGSLYNGVAKNQNSIYVWSLGTSFQPATAPWPSMEATNGQSNRHVVFKEAPHHEPEPEPEPQPQPEPTPEPRPEPPVVSSPSEMNTLFNPDRGENAVIVLDLDHAQHVNITLYDRTGAEILVLFNADAPSGRNTILWNGRDASGTLVPSGPRT
jgi:hypothetical protein